ncbi:hypothetical protein ACKI1O_47950, partial [Streptomyces scabiei]
MTEVAILLNYEQVRGDLYQLNSVIVSQIEQIKNQENLQYRYMNKKQTCKYLQISNNTLDSWIKEGLPKSRSTDQTDSIVSLS